jgi:hypothetical protein
LYQKCKLVPEKMQGACLAISNLCALMGRGVCSRSLATMDAQPFEQARRRTESECIIMLISTIVTEIHHLKVAGFHVISLQL